MFFVGQRSQRSIAPVLVNPGVELQSALEKSQEELRQAAEGLGVDGVLRDPVIPYRYYLSLFKILKGSYRFFFFWKNDSVHIISDNFDRVAMNHRISPFFLVFEKSGKCSQCNIEESQWS